MTGAVTSAGVVGRPDRAWRSLWAWLVFGLVVGLWLAVDLGTKHLAFARIAGVAVDVRRSEVLATPPGELQRLIPPHQAVVAVPGLLDLKLVLNAGAVFGAGQGKRVLFIGFTVLALLVATGLFALWTDRRDRLAQVGLGLIVSGGLGNLYDRIRFASVRDFLHPLPHAELPFGLHWPSGETAVWPYVSNVADAVLLVGIGLLLIRIWRGEGCGTGTDSGDDAATGTGEA